MFGNLKKKIALSIVGGFIPIMIIFLCLMVLIASTSTENKSIEDEMNIGSSMEIFVSIAEQECINVAGKKAEINIDSGILAVLMEQIGVLHL